MAEWDPARATVGPRRRVKRRAGKVRLPHHADRIKNPRGQTGVRSLTAPCGTEGIDVMICRRRPLGTDRIFLWHRSMSDP